MSGPSCLYRVDPDGVAVLTLSNAPVNALHPAGESKRTHRVNKGLLAACTHRARAFIEPRCAFVRLIGVAVVSVGHHQ